ncbi:MAG: FRG domain-containing protein [Candidatus Brocadiaceae bacterium]|nr:FRG domain-containing protein [Candidatus Brocadiaceae bacterium]
MNTIQSIAKYIDAVQNVLAGWGNVDSSTHAWFRGQSNSNWSLLPRLYRPEENPSCERQMFRDFKLRANAFISSRPENDMELLFVMQHYSMPTRLLDWTESHLFALFFAVEPQDIAVDAAIWILSPAQLNSLSKYGHRVPMSNHDVFSKYTLDVDATGPRRKKVVATYPMAVRPRRSTARVVAQRGMFTVHGNKQKSIDDFKRTEEFSVLRLQKLVIAAKSKPRIKKELLLAGISYSSLFPDLDGLSKEISYRYSKDYMKTEITDTT